MMNNGFTQGYGAGFMGGPIIGGSMPSPEAMNGIKVNPWLTPEDINALRKDTEQFTLSLTNEELKRAVCNHRDTNQLPSLKPELDGSCTCTICGYNFNVTEEYSQEQVVEACRVMENLLQTIKLMYISLDPTVGKDFFQILAFIKKIPKLYEIASNDYKRYEGVYTFSQGIPSNTFAIFGSLTTPGGSFYNPNAQMGYGAPAQPGYGVPPMPGAAPWAQPPQMNGYGAPAQPGYGYGQVPPQNNPFYQAPGYTNGYPNNGTMGYTGQQANMMPTMPGTAGYGQPQPTTTVQHNTGFAMNPQGAAGPAPTAPAPTAPVSAEGQAQVNGDYKA